MLDCSCDVDRGEPLLLEFLRETVVAHAMYIQDCLHRTMLANGAQYQHRLGMKPDTVYLCERGASGQSLW